MPVNAKSPHLNKLKPLRGEKAYRALFKRYKSVCHFIAALELCKEEDPKWDSSWQGLYPPREKVQRFINIAHWFRKNLLLLDGRNVPGKIFLKGEDLCPLPEWIQFEEVDFPIETIYKKVEKLWSNVQRIDPVTKEVTIVNLLEEDPSLLL